MNLLRLMKAIFTPASSPSPAGCASRLRTGQAVLIDVREASEWVCGVADRAMLLPLSDLTGPRAHWGPFLAGARDREILLYCASGARSGFAARLLAEEGFKVLNTGGLAGWAAADWPVVAPARNQGAFFVAQNCTLSATRNHIIP